LLNINIRLSRFYQV